MSSSLLTGLLGVALGMRHAVEPDHLAAVSTLATEQRNARAGLLLGALWGVGHTLSLLLVGGTLAVLEAQMPERVAALLELLVAIVVVALGVRALRTSLAEGRAGAPSTHRHGAVEHTHAAPREHLHLCSWTFATRPLLVGLLHGLAGSGALTALVLAELPTTASRLGYIALFGAGSVLGMALLTGAAGVPLVRLARSPRLATGLLGVAGALSIIVGLCWGAASVAQLAA
ncbi:MAG: urease accessory protein [Myxococcaceae bacterium]|nr:urease accessory protein [Myxococcaceae bacterium]